MFSPNNDSVAYIGKQNEKVFLVINEQEQEHFSWIGSPTFSPNGKLVVYAAKNDLQYSVVVDGVKGRKYDGFIPGGKIIFDSPNEFHYLARRGNEIYLVEETIEEP